ncbi:MAG: hypothetical protein RL662_2288, partial [Bacteroidota bacterium]
YRTILNRFDTTVSSWKSFNYIAFMVILLKKVKQNKSQDDFDILIDIRHISCIIKFSMH